MKKFGTPGLAEPGCASENVGLLLAGGCAWLSGAGDADGVGVGVATLPVSDSVLTALPVVWLAGLGLVLVLVGALPTFDRGFGVAVAVGAGAGAAVAVGWTVTATAGAAVGVGVESVEPRST